jgi:hypothetical protein
MRKPCPATSGDAFDLEGANLPKVVLRLREKESKLFRQWLEHIQSVIRGLKDIEVKRWEEDNALYLVLHYGGVAVKQMEGFRGDAEVLGAHAARLFARRGGSG